LNKYIRNTTYNTLFWIYKWFNFFIIYSNLYNKNKDKLVSRNN
jgi:hypothetical protein